MNTTDASSTDVFSPQKRAAIMAKVKSRDTTPERALRQRLHALGYRFRLHRKDLPGTPDIVLPGRRAVIFVHGCFWHGHDCKRGARVPKRNRSYWQAKIARNVARDARAQAELAALGWRTLVIWECGLKASDLDVQLQAFLGAPGGLSRPRNALPNPY